MIECIDTFYKAVRTRILTINPNRKFGGLMDSQSWPESTIQFEAFYCLVLGEAPIGRSVFSAAIPMYAHTIRWVWAVRGTDLNVDSSLLGENRGDRFRKHQAMKEELRQGMYPGFTEKKTFSANANTGTISATSFSPVEYIWWSPPRFMDRFEKSAGLTYGSADVQVCEMTGLISQ